MDSSLTNVLPYFGRVERPNTPCPSVQLARASKLDGAVAPPRDGVTAVGTRMRQKAHRVCADSIQRNYLLPELEKRLRSQISR